MQQAYACGHEHPYSALLFLLFGKHHKYYHCTSCCHEGDTGNTPDRRRALKAAAKAVRTVGCDLMLQLPALLPAQLLLCCLECLFLIQGLVWVYVLKPALAVKCCHL